MASIRKRGKSYQITVSNGRDIHNKQILETATWTPDPNKTEKQNQKALERKDGKPGGYSPPPLSSASMP